MHKVPISAGTRNRKNTHIFTNLISIIIYLAFYREVHLIQSIIYPLNSYLTTGDVITLGDPTLEKLDGLDILKNYDYKTQIEEQATFLKTG